MGSQTSDSVHHTDLQAIWDRVMETGSRTQASSRLYTAEELAEVICGRQPTAEEVDAVSRALEQPNPFFEPDKCTRDLYEVRPASAVARDMRAWELMGRIGGNLRGKLLLVDVVNSGAVPAVCLDVDQTGFSVIKVERSGEQLDRRSNELSDTYHPVGDLVCIVSEWQLDEPLDAEQERDKLYQVASNAQSLLQSIRLDAVIDILLGEGALSLGELAQSLDSADISGLPDSGHRLLILAWALSLRRDIFEFTVTGDGRTTVELVDRDLADQILESLGRSLSHGY